MAKILTAHNFSFFFVCGERPVWTSKALLLFTDLLLFSTGDPMWQGLSAQFTATNIWAAIIFVSVGLANGLLHSHYAADTYRAFCRSSSQLSLDFSLWLFSAPTSFASYILYMTRTNISSTIRSKTFRLQDPYNVSSSLQDGPEARRGWA